MMIYNGFVTASTSFHNQFTSTTSTTSCYLCILYIMLSIYHCLFHSFAHILQSLFLAFQVESANIFSEIYLSLDTLKVHLNVFISKACNLRLCVWNIPGIRTIQFPYTYLIHPFFGHEYTIFTHLHLWTTIHCLTAV